MLTTLSILNDGGGGGDIGRAVPRTEIYFAVSHWSQSRPSSCDISRKLRTLVLRPKFRRQICWFRHVDFLKSRVNRCDSCSRPYWAKSADCVWLLTSADFICDSLSETGRKMSVRRYLTLNLTPVVRWLVLDRLAGMISYQPRNFLNIPRFISIQCSRSLFLRNLFCETM